MVRTTILRVNTELETDSDDELANELTVRTRNIYYVQMNPPLSEVFNDGQQPLRQGRGQVQTRLAPKILIDNQLVEQRRKSIFGMSVKPRKSTYYNTKTQRLQHQVSNFFRSVTSSGL